MAKVGEKQDQNNSQTTLPIPHSSSPTPPTTTETDLNEAFIQFGNIIDMKSQFDRGFAFIK